MRKRKTKKKRGRGGPKKADRKPAEANDEPLANTSGAAAARFAKGVNAATHFDPVKSGPRAPTPDQIEQHGKPGNANINNNYFSQEGPPDGVPMGGRRRRKKTRRKQRGGCPPCLAAFALLGGSRKTRKKRSRKRKRRRKRRKTRRKRGSGFLNNVRGFLRGKKTKKAKSKTIEEMLGLPQTAEQQHAAAVAAANEVGSYEHVPSAANVATEQRFALIPDELKATNSEYVGAVASHHAGLGEKPRRNQPIAKDTIAMAKDSIAKLKKIKKKMKEKSSRDFLKKKIKNLEKLVAALEEDYTFIKKPVDI